MNKEVNNAMEFIRLHPEMIEVDIIAGLAIISVCKNGYFKTIDSLNDDMTVTVYPNDERYDEFEHLVNPCFPCDDSVEVQYEEFYGYPWTPVKMQYWFEYEMGFDIYGDTFEDFIVKFAKTLKYRYSDVNIDDYAKERKLHWWDTREINALWEEEKVLFYTDASDDEEIDFDKIAL